MQDKQNKGIGAYKDRPGYFMGGLIGGAILGALVNKMQGKDVMRGAMWGGITGGLGSAFLGAGAQGSTGWLSKMSPGITKSLATMGAGNPALAGTILGGGAAWMAGDPEYDREKWEAMMDAKKQKQIAENKKMYKYWYTNPWTGDEMYNTGGAVNARPGYPGGGSATLEYTDPDLYTPTGEGRGPSSSPILQIPLGPEGSFAEEFEDLDMASASDPMDEWNQMYENYLSQGGRPMPLPDFIEMMTSEGDFTPDYGAQGGYKTRPKYQGGGTTMTDEEKANVQGLIDIGYSELEAIQLVLNPGPEFLQSPSLGPKYTPGGDAQGGYKTRPQYQGGGIGDLDMTGGGASFGPGTGTSDDIPAMLSDGEFVVTANAVKNLGGGDRMEGARKMYSMMNQLDPDSQTPAEMSGVGYA
jgi:hypothetical protein